MAGDTNNLKPTLPPDTASRYASRTRWHYFKAFAYGFATLLVALTPWTIFNPFLKDKDGKFLLNLFKSPPPKQSWQLVAPQNFSRAGTLVGLIALGLILGLAGGGIISLPGLALIATPQAIAVIYLASLAFLYAFRTLSALLGILIIKRMVDQSQKNLGKAGADSPFPMSKIIAGTFGYGFLGDTDYTALTKRYTAWQAEKPKMPAHDQSVQEIELRTLKTRKSESLAQEKIPPHATDVTDSLPPASITTPEPIAATQKTIPNPPAYPRTGTSGQLIAFFNKGGVSPTKENKVLLRYMLSLNTQLTQEEEKDYLSFSKNERIETKLGLERIYVQIENLIVNFKKDASAYTALEKMRERVLLLLGKIEKTANIEKPVTTLHSDKVEESPVAKQDITQHISITKH